MAEEAEVVVEQQSDTDIVDDPKIDPLENEENIEAEENEIVLAGQEDPKEKPDPTNHILNRVMKRKEKLQDENADLRSQIADLVKTSGTATVQPKPDEYAFDNRDDYLAAEAKWQSDMTNQAVTNLLDTQQNGHRVAAKEQKRDAALTTYAKNAAGLKVSDFNETQDKAFDVLGDEFAQLIAENLPEDAPKLMYWLGKNPVEAARYRDDYKSNPGSTTFALGKLAGKLTIKPKRTQAADPESKLESEAVGGSTDWQKQLDKIDESADMSNISKSLNARRKVKAQAKAAGFDVSTLR